MSPKASPDAEPTQPEEATTNTSTSRAKLACKTCRAIKVRCIRPPEPNAACARCSRYNLPCTDPPVIKRKGRPPNSRRALLNSPTPNDAGKNSFSVSQTNQAGTSGGNMMNNNSDPSMSFFPAYGGGQQQQQQQQQQQLSHVSPPLLAPNAMTAQSLVDLSQSQPLATVSPTTQSHGSNNARSSSNKNLNMAEHLDPSDGDTSYAPRAPFFSHTPARRAKNYDDGDMLDKVNEGDDPVSLRVLSEVEANSLVQLFHQRLNPLVAVLDAQLHNVTYLRRTSSVLFSTVLATSSRFFRQDLHPSLISHAKTVLDRALQAGSTDIGIVQSLMILTYWKDPEDTSGWMKVGMAIRLGFSLFWHIPRTEPLPEDERDAREILNAERTWFCLFSFDRGQSYVHGLPTMIRLNHHGDPEQWARDHIHLGHSVDMHIAASIQLCKLKDQWGALCESKCPDPSYLELAIETLTLQAETMIARWFNKDVPPPCFDQEVEHVLLWSILDFIFVMKRYRLEMAPHDPLRLDACLNIISQIANEIDILARNGMLVIMQDSASCMTSCLGVFIRKVFRYSNRQQKSYMLTILHRVLMSHASVTDEDSKTAPAYVARFIRRVLSALSFESRAGTPQMSSAQLNGTIAQDVEVDFFAELGLEEFMHVPEYVAQNEADDGRYWANMLLSDVLPPTDM